MAVSEPRPALSESRPALSEPRPALSEPRPALSERRAATSERRAATSEPPAASEPLPPLPGPLPGLERRQRADAARNRERVLGAASELFREHGLDVGVSEIAERAGVGRATLFRNFPTKNDLIMAVLVERMREAITRGAKMLETGEPRGRLLESLIKALVQGQQMDRAVFEGVRADAFTCHPEGLAVHHEMLEVVDALIAADHAAGTVRGDIGAFDVLMLVKGACKVVADAHGEEGQRALARQVTLILSAVSAAAATACPFPDRPLSFAAAEQPSRG